MNTDMMLLVLSIFTLFLQIHTQQTFDPSRLTVSQASVYKESNTVQPKTDRSTDVQKDTQEASSKPSLFTSVTAYNKRPTFTVIHDYQLGEFRFDCEIPGSENTGYICYLLIGDDNKQLLKTGSYERSGKIQCIFTISENSLFIRLQSVKIKSVSCNYSPKTDLTKRSPNSDKYNLTAFIPVQNHKVTQHQTPNTTQRSTTYSTQSFSTITPATVTQKTATPLKPLNVSWSTTEGLNTSTQTAGLGAQIRLLMVIVTSGGVFLSGLMGVCLICFIRQKPLKKSPMNPSVASTHQSPDEAEEHEELSEENEDKVYHVYCTIPDISTEHRTFYSLAQMANQPL
ncbi:uncharacterized protein [Paramisgurnus dabryanus]|uniref:uncharacterized protein isoform X1 n=1 Tax=Paramisgurnus dabryanus TaxID=90735 RepID=UPI0031F3AA36